MARRSEINFGANSSATAASFSSSSSSATTSAAAALSTSATAPSASLPSSQSECFARQNKHLTKMLENEKQEKRRLETKISDLHDTIESQKKMIERLRDNRRLDPALRGDNNAIARSKSDASFAQARLRDAESSLRLKSDQIKKLQKEIETERRRADMAEREVTRVETEAKKSRERHDNAKFKELYHKVRDHFTDTRQASDESKIKHLQSKIIELELQILNPEKNELVSTIRRMEGKLEEEEKKKASLQTYLVDVQKQLADVHADLETSTRELSEAERRLVASDLDGREARGKLAAASAEKQSVTAEFEVFKRSVDQSLGDLVGNLDDDEDLFVEADLENIDHRELDDFLRNF